MEITAKSSAANRLFNKLRIKLSFSTSYIHSPDCEHQVRAVLSNNQGTLRIFWFLCPDMLYAPPPVGAKKIKTKAVLLRVDLIDQSLTKTCPLGRVNRALENGELNALTKILAGLGNPP